MVLGGGKIQTPIIEKIRELCYQSIVVDFDTKAPGLQLADIPVILSTNDIEGVLAKAIEYQIDGLLTTSDFPVNVVAKVTSDLNLKGMSTEVAKICTNKFMQRTFFKNNGIKHPVFKLVSSCEEASDFTDYPYIIKPLNSSASRGVSKINTYAELEVEFPNTVKYAGTDNNILIEKYIEGREFSVETLTQHQKTTIIAITEKLTRGFSLGAFVEDTHIIPARINEIEKKLIIDEVSNLIEKLKIDNCPTHTELKLNTDGAFVIEIACRLGGDYITSDLVKLSTGVDMMDNLIKLSIGEDINVKTDQPKVAAIQFLNDQNYQKAVQFIESKNPSIIRSEIEPYHTRPILSSLDRMGYIILQTDSPSRMEEILAILNN